jgi:sialic acid synthase SpsE
MGKKLVAARPLSAGTVLTADDVAMKSPGDALFPFHLDDLVGRQLAVDLDEDEALTFDHLSEQHTP